MFPRFLRVDVLEVGQVNTQSLPSSIDDHLQDSILHVMAVSETWLREDIPDLLLAVPGYVLVRNDMRQEVGVGLPTTSF